jgi:hypothetical protein
MARQMQEALKRGEQLPQVPQGRQMRTQDLQRMLDMIERMAQSGNRDAAQELLAQLENILRNMRPGTAGQMDSQQNSPMSQMMQQLGELMRRQQQLMDETFRMPDGMEGMEGMGPQQEGSDPGSRGSRGAEGLAGEQEALGRMLEELMRQLGQQGMQSPQSFGRAQRSMEGAAGSLRGRERERALGQQGEALEALRQGAQSMAQQMMQQQGQGNEGNYGPYGEARGDDRDPLGRPMPHRGEDYGPDYNMVPEERALERAREILQYLRSRANDRARPRIELDYLERLLRGLY